MTNSFEYLIESAISIGHQLTRRAKVAANGVYWPTAYDTSKPNKYKYSYSTSIYGGNTGIIIFFCELYSYTRDQKYLDIIYEGANRVYREILNSDFKHGFYGGSMGAVYLMLLLYKTTKDPKFLIWSVSLSKLKSGKFQNSGLGTGAAGNLLSYLHLYSIIPEPWVFRKMNTCIDYLVSSSIPNSEGICWESKQYYKNGLCDFTEGTAGIGYVFMEAGKLLNSDGLTWIGRQALLYTNHQLNKKKIDWSIFESISKKNYLKLQKVYLRGNYPLTWIKNNYTWSSGSIGLLLANLRAAKLLGNSNPSLNLNQAVDNLSNSISRIKPSSLDKGGSALILYRNLSKICNISGYANHIRKKTTLMLKNLRDTSDNGFLFGLSGLGYTCLHLGVSDVNETCLLRPDVPDLPKNKVLPPIDGIVAESQERLQQRIFSKTLPRTIHFLDNIICDQSTTIDNHSSYSRFIQQISEKINKMQNQMLNELYNLELKKMHLLENSLNNERWLLRAFFNSPRRNRLLNSGANAFSRLSLVQSSEVFLVNTKWNWVMNNLNSTVKESPKNYYFILQLTSDGVEEILTNEFIFSLLEKFSSKSKVINTINSMVREFETTGDEEIMIIKQACTDQLKKALYKRILEIA